MDAALRDICIAAGAWCASLLNLIQSHGDASKMKKLLSAGAVLFVLAAAAVLAAQDTIKPEHPGAQDMQGEWEMPGPEPEHLWLKRLVGEWNSEAEMSMGPEQPPMTSKGSDSVRALGDFWVMSNLKGDMAGQPFEGVMTLGYDPEKKKYIGTWVDSMTSYMWKYEGTVDATKNKLTLETEGPSPMGGTCKFRESIEFKSDDHRVFTSTMQDTDGQWITVLTANMHRKK